jgi:ubiquinone/menaquinone biosynthesis C-methylase UbiE
MGLKIEIGGGSAPAMRKHGYLNVDVRKVSGVDRVGSVLDLPFKDGEVEAVYCRNLLEHVKRSEVDKEFSEIYRVLCPGGIFEFEVPDIVETAKLYIAGIASWSEFMDCLFGAQRFPEDLHGTGFSQPMLISILVARGFKIETLTSVTLRNIVRLRGRCVKS